MRRAISLKFDFNFHRYLPHALCTSSNIHLPLQQSKFIIPLNMKHVHSRFSISWFLCKNPHFIQIHRLSPMSIYLTPANSYYLKKKISIDRGNAFECHSTRKTGGVSECQCNGELEKEHLHKIKTTLRLTCTRTRRVTSKKVNRIYKKIAYLSVTFSLIKLHFFTVLLEVTFSLVFLDFYVVFPHE